MWGRKRKAKTTEEPVNDIEQAQGMRADAKAEMDELLTQKLEVWTLARALSRRRVQNHFGEELTVSFRPKAGA